MLVISRKPGQGAVIAGNIRVVVLSAHGNRVKLGFHGPTNVPIHRDEVHDVISWNAVENKENCTERAGESIRV